MLKRLRRAMTGVFLAFPFGHALGRDPAEQPVKPSRIKSDEEVVFYPTYGSFDQRTGIWNVEVRGKVFEPEESSQNRARLIKAINATSGLLTDVDASSLREDRVRPFLVDNESLKRVAVAVGPLPFDLGRTGLDGSFRSTLEIRGDQWKPGSRADREVEVQAVLLKGDQRRFVGRIHLIPPQGVSVISDIDDTIKHSNVTDKSELIRNTFLRDFRGVEGMPQLYAKLAGSGAAFHYVSGSPWQLIGPISAWMRDAGFPDGTMHMKDFSLTNGSALKLIGSQNKMKLAAINPILKAFPQRRFILFGDSGEQDPEIYGEVARKHPEQIIGIFIHDVTGEKASEARFQKAFLNLPENLWFVSDDVASWDEEAMSRAQKQATSETDSTEH